MSNKYVETNLLVPNNPRSVPIMQKQSGKKPRKKISHGSKIHKVPVEPASETRDRFSRAFYALIKRNKKPPSKESNKVSNTKLKTGQYEIKGLICDGTFGKVMRAINVNTKITYAAKLEPFDTNCPQLHNEFRIYELLGHEVEGFVKIFHYGPCDRLFNALIMELLGPDLDDLFVMCRSSFSYKTVLIIAMQTIKLIKYIHDKGIIYRDIKPENFCIGSKCQDKEKIIHIIDFGLSKMKDSKSKISSDTPQVDYDYLVGTARYMSINAHFGIQQSKRDDLEALGYTFMFFLLGRLPWMGMSHVENVKNHYRAIADCKVKCRHEELLKKYPEFVNYISYVKNLEFTEQPDYEYLYKLMKDRFIEKCYTYDGDFDWTSAMNKQYLKRVIDVDSDE